MNEINFLYLINIWLSIVKVKALNLTKDFYSQV